jgi:hypothetical protein
VAKEQAEADANAMEDPDGGGIPEATLPEQPEPPAPEGSAPTGGAEADQAAPERAVADAAALEAEANRRAQEDGRPGGPTAKPASARLGTSQAVMVRIPLCPRQARASSEPRPVETGAVSSPGADTGATSPAPPGWAPGAGAAALNLAVQDVLDKFSAHGATLLKARSEMVAMQTSVRVCS